MPIYASGLKGAPWTPVKEMSITKLTKIITKFIKLKKENSAFANSLEYNTELNEVYVAKYDFSKTNIDVFRYQTYLEKLIDLANEEIFGDTKSKNLKFDIYGTFTIGKIIIMEKK